MSDLSEPAATEIAIEPAATMVKVEDFERELGLVPVGFTDDAEKAGGRGARADRADRTPPAASLDRSEDRPSSGGEDAAFPVVKTPVAVDAMVGRLVKVLDRAVVWVVRSLAPLVGDAITRSVRSLKSAAPKLKGLLARRASPAASGSAGDSPAVAPAPWSAPRPDPPPITPAAPVSAPPPWVAPAPAPPVTARAPVPPPAREAPPTTKAVPPPTMDKVGVIPFADGGGAGGGAAASAKEEVWDGEDAWEEPGPVAATFAVLWLWVKRVTITAALLVTAAALYLNKEKWLPQSKEAAIVLGESVDKLSDQLPRTVPPEAIETARTQIPYLRADTIELVMAKSTQGVLEPAEVLRRALQAVERARPSLPEQVAKEIDHHATAVVDALDPAEGERLRAYLSAMRAGTPTLSYQDKEAVWLMERGVRRMPADRVARMQELYAQAVTSVLEPPPPPS